MAFSGPAGSGKSEAARLLMEDHGFTNVKFSHPLKEMLRAYYRTQGLSEDDIERRLEGDLKEKPDPYLCGRTPRYAMITLGTEWGRELMANDFWTRAWGRAADSETGPVVVDDCRFPNEAEAVQAEGGEVIRLVPKVQRREANTHISEAGLPNHLVDMEVANDGTVGELREKVREALWPNAGETFGVLE